MLKLAKKLFVIGILLVFMVSVVSATAYAVSTPSDEKIVEYKEKKVTSYKIKWDTNGGKIGTKKTVTTAVKKGAKVKLAKTPKKAGYIFQGWYTKKSGGKKVTKNTKPTKSVTYFAHWKRTRTLNAEEKKLVGKHIHSIGNMYWESDYSNFYNAHLTSSNVAVIYTFNNDGTFEMFTYSWGKHYGYTNYKAKIRETGNWAVTSSNTIILTNKRESRTVESPASLKSMSYTNQVKKNEKLYYVSGIREHTGDKGYYLKGDSGGIITVSLKDLKEQAENGAAWDFYKTTK